MIVLSPYAWHSRGEWKFILNKANGPLALTTTQAVRSIRKNLSGNTLIIAYATLNIALDSAGEKGMDTIKAFF